MWWAGKDSNLRRLCRQIYSLLPLAARAPTREARRYRDSIAAGGPPEPARGSSRGEQGATALHYRVGMPTFDVVSQVDMQEVRNAVDQANREAGDPLRLQGNRLEIELGENDMVLRSSTEDRLRALHQVLEEKLVRREVSLKALEDGKIEEAAKGTVRQHIAIKAGISADHAKQINKFIKDMNLKGVSSQAQGDQLRVIGQEARRPAGRHQGAQGAGLRDPPAVPELPGLIPARHARSRPTDAAALDRRRLRARRPRPPPPPP